MRFPGFGSPGRNPSFRLSGPLGEQRVVLSLNSDGRVHLRSKAGEVRLRRRRRNRCRNLCRAADRSAHGPHPAPPPCAA